MPPLHRALRPVSCQHGRDKAAVRDGSVFEYCRLTDTVIQAWSVLQHGYFKGNFSGQEEFAALNHVLTDLAKKYQVTPTAIAPLGSSLPRKDAVGHPERPSHSMSLKQEKQQQSP